MTCGSASHLWTIDRNTGVATQVGSGITGAGCIIAMAVSPDGLMYGIDIVTDSLYAIDKTNGTAALIGSIGFNANYAQDMTFDQSTGILYFAGLDAATLTDSMYTVDLNTGLATPIAPIGSGGGIFEIDAMAIETASGPCAQPEDLPWLTVSPTMGTTAPSGTTPVTLGIDATGYNDGDTLSGTVCITSNDPDEHVVAVPVSVDVQAGGNPNIIDSGPIDLAIFNDVNGLYINWLTGAICTTASGGGCGSVAGAYNLNAYGSTNLTFFWSGGVAASSDCVMNAANCALLASGATIGPASTFGNGAANLFRAGGVNYLGFQFVNANTTQVNYGYAKFTTTGPTTGYPATLNEYWYDNSGAAITIP